MPRETYLRGGVKIDQRFTADCLDRVSDWLDIADAQSVTSVYPQLPACQDDAELAIAWCWAAVLIANMTDAGTPELRQLATAIRGMYAPSDGPAG